MSSSKRQRVIPAEFGEVGPQGPQGGERTWSQKLQEDGIIVYPLFSAEELPGLQQRFREQLRMNPLIKPEYRDAYMQKPAMSAFGAMGDPWTFNMAVQLEVNARTDAWVKANLPNFGGKSKHFMLRDRAMVRVPGTSISGESAHRDQGPTWATVVRGDLAMGGWCSIEGPQKFSCIPGSHLGYVPDRSGFVAFSKEQQKDLKARMQTFEVPPGYGVMFFQHIIHEVKSGKISTWTSRIFQGVVFTDFTQPWFPGYAMDIIMKELPYPDFYDWHQDFVQFQDDSYADRDNARYLDTLDHPSAFLKTREARENPLKARVAQIVLPYEKEMDVHPTTEESLTQKGIYLLPSGQTPWMYERLHMANWAPRIVEYSKMFIDTVPRNAKGFIPQAMGPLSSYIPQGALPAAYTQAEKAIYFPQNF